MCLQLFCVGRRPLRKDPERSRRQRLTKFGQGICGAETADLLDEPVLCESNKRVMQNFVT